MIPVLCLPGAKEDLREGIGVASTTNVLLGSVRRRGWDRG